MLTKTLPGSPESAEDEEVCDNEHQTDARAAPPDDTNEALPLSVAKTADEAANTAQVEMLKPSSQPPHIEVLNKLKRPTEAPTAAPNETPTVAPTEQGQGNAVADDYAPLAKKFKVSAEQGQGNAVADDYAPLAKKFKVSASAAPTEQGDAVAEKVSAFAAPKWELKRALSII